MFKNNEDFKIKTYTKKELACLYFPDAKDPHTAVNHLMAWVHRCRGLPEKLAELGYHKNSRLLTPRQVREIVFYLGEP